MERKPPEASTPAAAPGLAAPAPTGPQVGSAASLLRLQRVAGNRAVLAALRAAPTIAAEPTIRRAWRADQTWDALVNGVQWTRVEDPDEGTCYQFDIPAGAGAAPALPTPVAAREGKPYTAAEWNALADARVIWRPELAGGGGGGAAAASAKAAPSKGGYAEKSGDSSAGASGAASASTSSAGAGAGAAAAAARPVVVYDDREEVDGREYESEDGTGDGSRPPPGTPDPAKKAPDTTKAGVGTLSVPAKKVADASKAGDGAGAAAAAAGPAAAVMPPGGSREAPPTLTTPRQTEIAVDGAFWWLVRMTTARVLPFDSWIVQHVQLTGDGPNSQFWEAFFVRAGGTAAQGDDVFEELLNAAQGTRNVVGMMQHLVFPGGGAPPGMRAGGGGHAARGQMTTMAQPAWWNPAGGVRHELTYTWDGTTATLLTEPSTPAARIKPVRTTVGQL